MQQWRKNVYMLWVAIFVAAICWSMVMPFIPVFLEEELGVKDHVATWAGALGAVNFMAQAITAPIWGAVGDRFGRKMMMLRAGFFLTLAYTLMVFVQSPTGLLGVRLMIGGLTGFIPMAIALVGVSTAQEHVGKALALIATAGPTGSIVGPLFGGLFSDFIGIRGTMGLAAVMIAGATVLVLVTVKEQFQPPAKEKKSSMFADMAEVLRTPAFGAIIVVTSFFTASVSSLEPVLVPFTRQLLGEGAPNWLSGGLYALPGLSMIMMASWWAGRGTKWGYQTTVMLGLFGAGLLTIPQALAFGAIDFGAMRFGQGLMQASVNPGITSMIALVVPVALRGRAYGMNQSAFAVGAMIGPLLGGAVGDLLGLRYSFALGGSLFIIGGLWTWLVVRPQVNSVLAKQEKVGTTA